MFGYGLLGTINPLSVRIDFGVSLNCCLDGRGVNLYRFCFFYYSFKRLANVPLSLRKKPQCVRVAV